MSEREPMNRQERRKAKRAQDHKAARERGQVTPDELQKDKVYVIPSHGYATKYKIISVGPKWITWKQEGMYGWSRTTRVLKSGWDGPYFLQVDASS